MTPMVFHHKTKEASRAEMKKGMVKIKLYLSLYIGIHN